MTRPDPTRATAYSVVVPGGDWMWTIVGGDEEMEIACDRANGSGGWLIADGLVIRDYRPNPKAADSPADVGAHPSDHHGASEAQRAAQGDCAGTGPDPEGAGDAPGADVGVEPAETAQAESIGTYNATLQVALRRCLNQRMGTGPFIDSAVDALVPVVQQLVDQAVGANAEQIAVALDAEATKRFAVKTNQDYQQMHDAAGGAFNDAADIAREHGKARP